MKLFILSGSHKTLLYSYTRIVCQCVILSCHYIRISPVFFRSMETIAIDNYDLKAKNAIQFWHFYPERFAKSPRLDSVMASVQIPGQSSKWKYEKIFLRQLTHNKFLTKTVRVNKIAMKSFSKIYRPETTFNYRSATHV